MFCLIQALRKRLQGVTGRLGSEVKDGGVAREVEDAINELQRQMGDFERSVSEHQKTLDMTRRLQQAMEEVTKTDYITFFYLYYYFVWFFCLCYLKKRYVCIIYFPFTCCFVWTVSVLVRGGECDDRSSREVFLRVSQHRSRFCSLPAVWEVRLADGSSAGGEDQPDRWARCQTARSVKTDWFQ